MRCIDQSATSLVAQILLTWAWCTVQERSRSLMEAAHQRLDLTCASARDQAGHSKKRAMAMSDTQFAAARQQALLIFFHEWKSVFTLGRSRKSRRGQVLRAFQQAGLVVQSSYFVSWVEAVATARRLLAGHAATRQRGAERAARLVAKGNGAEKA